MEFSDSVVVVIGFEAVVEGILENVVDVGGEYASGKNEGVVDSVAWAIGVVVCGMVSTEVNFDVLKGSLVDRGVDRRISQDAVACPPIPLSPVVLEDVNSEKKNPLHNPL